MDMYIHTYMIDQKTKTKRFRKISVCLSVCPQYTKTWERRESYAVNLPIYEAKDEKNFQRHFCISGSDW